MGSGEEAEIVGVGGVVLQALFGVTQFDAGAGGLAEAAQEGAGVLFDGSASGGRQSVEADADGRHGASLFYGGRFGSFGRKNVQKRLRFCAARCLPVGGALVAAQIRRQVSHHQADGILSRGCFPKAPCVACGVAGAFHAHQRVNVNWLSTLTG
ncbi:hypothetical protein [Streptomyces cyaneofuscatus]|uniref:hypothetical protein n=1 Tax=Streptomyces cyaneofuscatus TaxID=66883 RepID=UPI003F4DF848